VTLKLDNPAAPFALLAIAGAVAYVSAEVLVVVEVEGLPVFATEMIAALEAFIDQFLPSGAFSLAPAARSVLPTTRLASVPAAIQEVPQVVLDDLGKVVGSDLVAASTITELTVDQSQKGPGQNVHYTATGFTPNGDVYAFLAQPNASTLSISQELKADAGGFIGDTLRLPTTAQAGDWLVVAVDITAMRMTLLNFAAGRSSVLHFFMAANTVTIPTYEVESIDIKPGDTTNSINLKSNGVIPVVILSTKNFDATTIKPASVVFGPEAAIPTSGTHMEDVNGDGLLDLVVQFRTQNVGITPNDQKVCLIAQIKDNSVIAGCDKITILP
jgi:hypothetical protein